LIKKYDVICVKRLSREKNRRWLVKKQNIGLILGPLLFGVTILAPVPPSMAMLALDNSLPALAPQLALGAMLWMVIWWITKCVPLGITGLIVPLVFTLSGIVSRLYRGSAAELCRSYHLDIYRGLYLGGIVSTLGS
jgi:di/tricarboxylate transporter